MANKDKQNMFKTRLLVLSEMLNEKTNENHVRKDDSGGDKSDRGIGVYELHYS